MARCSDVAMALAFRNHCSDGDVNHTEGRENTSAPPLQAPRT